MTISKSAARNSWRAFAELAQQSGRHPALGRARTLLNTTFRKASLVQRAAVLKAADWLIMMIDRAQMLL